MILFLSILQFFQLLFAAHNVSVDCQETSFATAYEPACLDILEDSKLSSDYHPHSTIDTSFNSEIVTRMGIERLKLPRANGKDGHVVSSTDTLRSKQSRQIQPSTLLKRPGKLKTTNPNNIPNQNLFCYTKRRSRFQRKPSQSGSVKHYVFETHNEDLTQPKKNSLEELERGSGTIKFSLKYFFHLTQFRQIEYETVFSHVSNTYDLFLKNENISDSHDLIRVYGNIIASLATSLNNSIEKDLGREEYLLYQGRVILYFIYSSFLCNKIFTDPLFNSIIAKSRIEEHFCTKHDCRVNYVFSGMKWNPTQPCAAFTIINECGNLAKMKRVFIHMAWEYLKIRPDSESDDFLYLDKVKVAESFIEALVLFFKVSIDQKGRSRLKLFSHEYANGRRDQITWISSVVKYLVEYAKHNPV